VPPRAPGADISIVMITMNEQKAVGKVIGDIQTYIDQSLVPILAAIVVVDVSAADQARLEAIVADRNSRQKHVWRARIILATAEGCGTAEIMRRARVSKPCVWRWSPGRLDGGDDPVPPIAIKSQPWRSPAAANLIWSFGICRRRRPEAEGIPDTVRLL